VTVPVSFPGDDDGYYDITMIIIIVVVVIIIIIIMTEIITIKPVLRQQAKSLRIYNTVLKLICYHLLNGAFNSNKTPCTILTGQLMTSISYKVINLGVFTARMIHISVLCVMTPCTLVNGYKHFGEKYYRHLHVSILRMETVCSSETVTPTYQNVQVHEP
jgi:hypothetical protein